MDKLDHWPKRYGQRKYFKNNFIAIAIKAGGPIDSKFWVWKSVQGGWLVRNVARNGWFFCKKKLNCENIHYKWCGDMDYKQTFTLIENWGVQMDQSWDTEPMTEPGGDDTVISWRQQGYKQELHRRGLSRWITSLSKLSRMIMSVGERSQGMNQIG